MPQVLFDTHAAARKLEKAGHTAQQAEAVVEVVSAATEFGARMQHDLERIKYVVENHMATKDDLAELRTATKEDIAELRMATKEDIAELRAATKEDIAELRAATKEDITELRMATKEDIAELRMSTKDDIAELRTDIAKMPELVRKVLRQETPVIQLRSVMAAGSLTFSLGGLAVMVLTNERLTAMALEHGSLIGLMMTLAGSAVMMFIAWAGRSG
ncbi:MAG: DUF1640 domain-containing protein [Gammaproteobacteria bacterium]|nr:DUF1640 domain-containing protein [Gammaproteobacteria bacterium]